MSTSQGFDSTWEAVYQARNAPMRYPFEIVVQFIMRCHPRNKPREETRILEIGCGTGNNLWFAAREGFSVTGIDAAPTAIAFAQRLFAEEKQSGDLAVGFFGDLAFPDASFDLVFDHGALTCTGRSMAEHTIREVHRVLRPGGKFLFTPFSTDDSSFAASEPGPDGTRINITGGTVQHVGQICFYSRQDIESVFGSGWALRSLELSQRSELLNPEPVVRSIWHVIAEKIS